MEGVCSSNLHKRTNFFPLSSMKFFNIICLVLAVAWTVFLARGYKNFPALGPMLEVHRGVWAHRSVAPESATIAGLKKPVTVTLDASGVPHFFAHDESDLFMAQGFLSSTLGS